MAIIIRTLLTHYSRSGAMISVAVQCDWSNTNYMASFLIQHHWKKRQNCLREYKIYIYIYTYRNPKKRQQWKNNFE